MHYSIMLCLCTPFSCIIFYMYSTCVLYMRTYSSRFYACTPNTQHTCTPNAQHTCTPNTQHTCTPNTQHTCTPNAQHTCTPNTQHTCTPNTQHTCTPNAQHTHERCMLTYVHARSFRMLEADVGRTTYPDYDIIVTKPLFSSAEEFTRYVCPLRLSVSARIGAMYVSVHCVC